jgi:hypothetical protein
MADITVTKDEIVKRVTGHLTRMRNFRRPYDPKRSLFYRQYVGQRDPLYFPDKTTPRSNTSVQYPFSNVETTVSRVHDAFFSFPQWFDCNGRGENDSESAERMQTVLEAKLKASRAIEAIEDLARTISIYGHGALKVDWDWGYDTVIATIPQPAIDPNTGQPLIDPTTGQPVIAGYSVEPQNIPRNRPKFIPIDIYDLLLDPDGGMAAHLTEKSLGQLLSEASTRDDLYFPEGIQELQSKLRDEKTPAEIIIRIAEFWNEHDKTVTIITFNDSEAIAWKDRRAAYRAASYSAFRNKVYGGPPIVLYHGPNPYPHGRIPILHTSYVRLPNEVYGIGVIEPISDMTESLSKFVSMVVDNWNLGINKRFAYDTGADIDHLALRQANVPGGMVGVSGDPSKVIYPLPSFTPQAGDYSIIELYRGLIEMTSGISDFYSKGVGSGGSNETATGINQIIGESNYRFKLFIRNIENFILQPMLSMCASMVQKYVTDEEEFLITDAPPGIPKYLKVRPQELTGNFNFDIVAASYATNKVIRQRNLMAFVNVVGQSQYWNEYEALKELAKVFEIKNINKLLKTPEQVAQEQQQQLLQQIQIQEEMAKAEHARNAEKILLQGAVNTEAKARLEKAKPRPIGQGGAKGTPGRRAQFEGKVPGAGLTSTIRDLAQNMGANALGLEGIEGG